MKLTRDFAPLSLALLSGIGCTSSSQRGPATSAPNDSATDSAESTSNPGRTDGDPIADSREAADGAPAYSPQRPVVAAHPVGPYRVRIVDATMHDLSLFRRDGRSYVLGTIRARYSVVLTNSTARRVEAVISIDGLDAIDGKGADYVHKRGYILPAYGSATIEGFRTSLERVAAFRFSSVADSYAGRQGQPRDVGVIGVAFFPEQAPVAMIPPPVRRYNESFYDDSESGRPPAPSGAASHANRSAAAPAAPAAASPPSPEVAPLAEQSSSAGALGRDRAERKGLGTEFGEARESHVEETEFVRANATLPSDIVTFRYNDREGLVALGFRLDPPGFVDAELRTRQTADPFRANRFSAPPP
jgi:hypothetical protein